MKIKKEKYDYYYTRDVSHGIKIIREEDPIVIVCYLLTENGVVGRGISVLSKQDVYDETEGKKLAKINAIRAIKGRSIDIFRRKEVIARLIQTKCPFIKKGERNPRLNWWERRFLFGAKNMHEYNATGYFSSIDFDIKDLAMAKATPQQLYAVAQRRQRKFANICAEELCQHIKELKNRHKI